MIIFITVAVVIILSNLRVLLLQLSLLHYCCCGHYDYQFLFRISISIHAFLLSFMHSFIQASIAITSMMMSSAISRKGLHRHTVGASTSTSTGIISRYSSEVYDTRAILRLHSQNVQERMLHIPQHGTCCGNCTAREEPQTVTRTTAPVIL